MEVIVCAGIDRGQEECPRLVWSASASMIRARAAAMVGFSASASRSAVERSIGYSPGGGGIKGGDGTGTFRSSCLVSGFSACVASAAADGLAWEGPWVAVEVRATAGSRAEFVASGDWSRVWAAMDGAVRAVLELRSVAQPEKRRAEPAQRRTTNVAIDLRVGSNIASVLACIGCPLCRTLKTVNSASGRTARRSIGGGFAALGIGCGHAAGSDALGGDRMRQGIGRGLSQGDVELELSAVIVDDGVDVVDPRTGHQPEAVQQLDRQDVARPVPDPREVLR